ncbi:MAG: YceI family protein [Chitinophagaceae bacterium]
MKNYLLLFFASLVLTVSSFGQKYFTKTGKITFDATSASSPEKVEAVNRTSTCVMDTKSGAIQFSVLIKGFAFERALMEEHFNENYLESTKYPKAEFKGTIENNDAVNYAKDGTYAVTVKGKLIMHGVTRDVETKGKLVVQGGKINTLAEFSVLLADYNVSIPGLVADKVAKTAKIIVSCLLDPLKN